MNRLTFAKRAFSTSAARMSGGTTTPADVKTWKMLTFLVGGPAIIFGHYMAFRPHFAPYPGEDPHARPEFVAYDYLRLRSKVKFKVKSLFEIEDVNLR